MTMHEIDAIVASLYTKYGNMFFESRETIEYFASLNSLDKAKFLFIVSYELQELKPGLQYLFMFDQFISQVEYLPVEDENFKLFDGLLKMSKALSKQAVVPNTVEELLDQALEESNPKEYISTAVFYLLAALDDISNLDESVFGNNVILKCIYDYETDVLYRILLNYTGPFDSANKKQLDHPLAFCDRTPDMVEKFSTALHNYMSKDYIKIKEEKEFRKKHLSLAFS